MDAVWFLGSAVLAGVILGLLVIWITDRRRR
jgi:hypothetical protein